MESHFISWRSSTFHYHRFGHGAEWLFCFHGYGEDAGSFLVFEELLKSKFTFIVIDMPFHGQTDWKEGLSFSTKELIEVINLIKPAQEPMSLLGYSMGGRVALRLTEVIPQLIKRTVVVAPDGLHRNKWQWLSTQTLIGNRLFDHTMRHPFWMFRFMDIAGKWGLFNKSILKFVHHYLDDAEQRLALYRRWTTLRELRPNLALLERSITKYKIPVRMLFGKYDSVILTKHGTSFSKKGKGHIVIKEIEAGHQLLREKYASVIMALLVE